MDDPVPQFMQVSSHAVASYINFVQAYGTCLFKQRLGEWLSYLHSTAHARGISPWLFHPQLHRETVDVLTRAATINFRHYSVPIPVIVMPKDRPKAQVKITEIILSANRFLVAMALGRFADFQNVRWPQKCSSEMTA